MIHVISVHVPAYRPVWYDMICTWRLMAWDALRCLKFKVLISLERFFDSAFQELTLCSMDGGRMSDCSEAFWLAKWILEELTQVPFSRQCDDDTEAAITMGTIQIQQRLNQAVREALLQHDYNNDIFKWVDATEKVSSDLGCIHHLMSLNPSLFARAAPETLFIH